MKHFLFALLVTIISFTFTMSPAMAAKETTTILHCGCYYDSIDGASMLFHEIDVSIKSKGHRNHMVDSEDSCFTGLINEEATGAAAGTVDESSEADGPGSGEQDASGDLQSDQGPVGNELS